MSGGAGFARAERVRSAIQQVVASEVERLKDPRVGFVTITDVQITRDLRHATILYTTYGTDAERASTHAALRHAVGHIRTTVAREVRLRFAPAIRFVEDAGQEHSRRVDELLAELHRKQKDDE